MRRPAKMPEGEGRKAINTRLRQEIRAALMREAEQAGRSLAAEIELRLEHSLLAQDLRDVVRDEFRRQREDADVPPPNMSERDLREWRGH